MMTTTTASPSSSSSSSSSPNFYVLAREQGTVRNDLPAWTSHESDPFQLGYHLEEDDENSNEMSCAAVEHRDVVGVPGAFQILNVFSKKEMQRMVDKFEDLGFTDDAAVSLPHNIRHNQNLNWIVDDATLQIIWDRCKDYFFVENKKGHHHDYYFQGKKPLGLNGKFRVYKYAKHDYFKLHSDASWPGTRVVNGKLVLNGYDNDRWSMYSLLIFLTDDYEGGETEFLVNQWNSSLPAQHLGEAKVTRIRTPRGGMLCFPHGDHPLHCLHSSAMIMEGVKMIIRTDVLFEL